MPSAQFPVTISSELNQGVQLARTHATLAAACLGHPALPALLERCASEGGQVGEGLLSPRRRMRDEECARMGSRCAAMGSR